MKFAKGNPGGPGRPAGRPNIASREVKADLLKAYKKVGGVKYLAWLAKEHPDVFGRHLGKLIPREDLLQVSGQVDVHSIAAPAYEEKPRADWTRDDLMAFRD